MSRAAEGAGLMYIGGATKTAPGTCRRRPGRHSSRLGMYSIEKGRRPRHGGIDQDAALERASFGRIKDAEGSSAGAAYDSLARMSLFLGFRLLNS
jgi:hypothetical protein